jgi:hypothetical protein
MLCQVSKLVPTQININYKSMHNNRDLNRQTNYGELEKKI